MSAAQDSTGTGTTGTDSMGTPGTTGTDTTFGYGDTTGTIDPKTGSTNPTGG